jgi:hypothetical protein
MTDDILSKEEKLELRKKAEDEIALEAKEAAKEQYLETQRKIAKRKQGVIEALEEVYIDLPESSANITLDGHMFLANHSYTVPKSQADVMRDIMARSWNHEAEINGRKKNFFTQRNTVIGPGGVRNAPVSPGLRV